MNIETKRRIEYGILESKYSLNKEMCNTRSYGFLRLDDHVQLIAVLVREDDIGLWLTVHVTGRRRESSGARHAGHLFDPKKK